MRGDKLYLLARDPERLAALSADLSIRGATAVEHAQLDVNRFGDHQRLLDTAFENLREVDIVLIAHGSLPDQKACESDFDKSMLEINTNAVSTISLLTHIANKLEVQNRGGIAVITSVAGDRGRQSNYLYGAAKGMLSIFLQGLRNRLYKSGVSVLDIKPGFVDTPMTADFKKGLLWSNPEAVAHGIVKAIDKRKAVVYLPWFWKYIMLVIRAIPENYFKRLKL